MNIAAIAFSERGMALGERLRAQAAPAWTIQLTRCASGGLADWTAAAFAQFDGLLFIGSTGIAVRAIAPYVRDKAADPAVLVIDEFGLQVIALLSGHLGGAVDLTRQAAGWLNALPVITTATDLAGVFAVDAWARRQNLQLRRKEQIARVSGALLANRSTRWQSVFAIAGAVPEGVWLTVDTEDPLSAGKEPADVVVAMRQPQDPQALWLIPRALVLGVGCRQGTSAETLDALLDELLGRTGIAPEAILQVQSIDRKAEEPGLLVFCQRHGWLLRTFSAAELAAVDGQFHTSDFVARTVGVDNVCERAACVGGGRLLIERQARQGVTLALAWRDPELTFD